MRDFLRGVATMVRLSFRADRRRSLVVFVLTPLGQALFAFNALLLGLVTDAVIGGRRAEALWWAGALGAQNMVAAMIVLGAFVARMTLQERTDLAIDQHLIELTAGIPTLDHHERPDYLDKLESLRIHRQALNQVIGGIVFNLSNVVQIAITGALLVRVHPLLILLPVAAVPSLWIAGRSQKRLEKVEDDTAEESRRALHLFDLATSAEAGKELRVFGLQDVIRGRYRALWTQVDSRRNKARARAALERALGWTFFAAGYAAALLLVVREAAEGRATPGEVVTALMLAGRVNGEVAGMAGMVSWLLSSLETVGRYLWLVDYARERRAAVADPAAAPERLHDGIRFEGVAFRYPATGVDVLSDVDITFPAGSTVALVGENGAGKTTLIKLLCGFYAPTAGRILVDGVDLSRIPPAAWRERMSAGFQDFARFEVLAREVVGLGDLGRIDDEPQVRVALGRAGALDVVERLPDGLGSLVGSTFDGEDLSGGQWQKLALGRAMMRDVPLLLVLDEPTASLDAETEHALFERYAGAARELARETGAITLLVSHRFSTVRMADLIVVVAGGRVSEFGGHTDLIARRGLYAELYELQARAYR